jgi:hypothetical protein
MEKIGGVDKTSRPNFRRIYPFIDLRAGRETNEGALRAELDLRPRRMASPRRRDALLSAWTCAWASPEAGDPLLPRPVRCPSGASSLARRHEWFHVKRGRGRPQGVGNHGGVGTHGASAPRGCRHRGGCRYGGGVGTEGVSVRRGCRYGGSVGTEGVSVPTECRYRRSVGTDGVSANPSGVLPSRCCAGHRNRSPPLQAVAATRSVRHTSPSSPWRSPRVLRRPSPPSRLGPATLPGSAFPAARPLYAGPVA